MPQFVTPTGSDVSLPMDVELPLRTVVETFRVAWEHPSRLVALQQRLQENGVRVTPAVRWHSTRLTTPVRIIPLPVDFSGEAPPDPPGPDRELFEAPPVDMPDATSHRYYTADWTGRASLSERVFRVAAVGPTLAVDLSRLVELAEQEKRNTDEWHEALDRLRRLRSALDSLILDAEAANPSEHAFEVAEAALSRVSAYADQYGSLFIGAPALTYGIVHLLAWMFDKPIDTTLVSAVFGAVVAKSILPKG